MDLGELLDRASASQADPSDREAARLAVEEVFAEAVPKVYRLCLRLLGNPEDAREAAQETALIAWRRLGEVRPDVPMVAWMYGIARYRCLGRRRRRRDLLCDDGVLEATDPGASALSTLRRQERRQVVLDAAASLQPLEQEAVYLRYVEGLPQDRITELLGLQTASGARGLLQRCRRKLARELRRRLDTLGHGSSFVRTSS